MRRLVGALLVTTAVLLPSLAQASVSTFTLSSIHQAVTTFETTLATNGTLNVDKTPALLSQMSTLSSDYPNQQNTPPVSGTGCFQGMTAAPVLNVCHYGDVNSPTTVVLFGDSHMQMYLNAFAGIAQTRGWHLETLLREACGAAESKAGAPDPKVVTPCLAWRKLALAKIAQLQPTMIIYTTSYGLLPTATAGAQEYATAQQLIASVKNHVARNVVSIVDVLRQNYGTIHFPVSGATCVQRANFVITYDAENNSTKNPMAHNPNVCYRVYNLTGANVADTSLTWRNQLPTQDAKAKVTVIDPRTWICDTTTTYGVCPPLIDGTLVYMDSVHLSMSFVARLRDLLSAQLPL